MVGAALNQKARAFFEMPCEPKKIQPLVIVAWIAHLQHK
jgi:hypothetical protein